MGYPGQGYDQAPAFSPYGMYTHDPYSGTYHPYPYPVSMRVEGGGLGVE